MKIDKKVLLPIFILGLFTWLIWPSAVQNTNPSSDNTKARLKAKNPEKLRTPERKPEFIKSKDIKIKPKENESTLLSEGRIKTPTVSEQLQEELADIKENGYGLIPPIDIKNNLNPQKLSVISDLESGDTKNLSAVGKRELFDKERYQNDPKAYLKEYMSTLSVSRCFETAQPGEGIKVLKRGSPQFVETYQNEPVKLIIEGAEPNMIFSASVFDGGHFDNDLSAITAQTDASGRGTLIFTPTDGVINNTRISVASPLSSGVVRFNIYVKKKREESNP